MTYNIHPLFVHFPIALLFMYSIIKVIPFSKWFPRVSWKDIERALLLIGVLGAFVALATGDTAESLTRPNRALVEMHSTFASLSTWIYGALLLGELLYFVTPLLITKLKVFWINHFLIFIQNLLLTPLISKLLALFGLIAISVTGLLGGVMVYGVSADPIAGIVLKLLGINY